MKRSTPVTINRQDDWFDSSTNRMVDSNGNTLVFNSALTVSPFELTIPPTNRDLTIPPQKMYSNSVSVTITQVETWIDSGGRSLVDSGGNAIVFNSAKTANAKPILLTIPADEKSLVVEE